MKTRNNKIDKIFFSICIIVISLLLLASGQKLKNVLVIGDSISIGYTPYIQKNLSSDAYVEHCSGNGGSTVRGLSNLTKWLGNKEWDVIVFNFGLHDLVYKDSLGNYDVKKGKQAVSLAEYQENLEIIIKKLKETTATLIFVTTTVVPENATGRKVEDPARYNAVACMVMKKNNIQVIDLYSVSMTVHVTNAQASNNVHYTEKGYELLAEPITTELRKILR